MKPLESLAAHPGNPADGYPGDTNRGVARTPRAVAHRHRGHAQQDAVISRLDALQDRGAVEATTVEVWGDQIAADDTATTAVGQRIRDRIEAFRSLAAANDRSIDPFFQTESVDAEMLDDEYTRIRFPTMTSPGMRTMTSGSSVRRLTAKRRPACSTGSQRWDPRPKSRI